VKPTRKFLEKVIVETGLKAKKMRDKAVVKYSKRHEMDLVTNADLACNKFITNMIRKHYPSHSIISEEAPRIKNSSEYSWLIDPIDGTKNYAKQHFGYGVMVTVLRGKDVIMSAIYIPESQQLYFAEKGKGAFLNRKRVVCSKTKDFGNSIGIITSKISPRRIELEKNILAYDKGHLHIEALYGANTAFCPVISGARDWVVSGGGGEVWDYAPAYLLLKEAGCKVTDLEGKNWTLDKKGIVAANPALHRTLINILGSKHGRRRKQGARL